MGAIRLVGVYRGDGVGYIEMAGAPCDRSICLVTAEGESLPLIFVDLAATMFGQIDVSTTPRFAVVFPLVQTEKLTLNWENRQFKKTFSSFGIKLRSKSAYLFSRKQAMSVRDCDRRSCDAASIRFIQVIESTECMIARAHVDLPVSCADMPVDLQVVDARGRTCDEGMFQLFRMEDSAEGYNEEGVACRRMTVSVRFSRTREPFGLVARCGGRKTAEASPEGESSRVSFHAACMLLDDTYEALRAGFAKETLNAMEDPAYHQWWLAHKASSEALNEQRRWAVASEQAPGTLHPRFSVIVPLYKTPLTYFNEMYQSVISQSYPLFELILVNASPDDKTLTRHLDSLDDTRVTVLTAQNEGIAQNTNVGIAVAKGDYLCFLDHDDMLAPDALYEYAQAIVKDSSLDLLYCDEDRFDSKGVHKAPFFKPDFSPELLRAHNYITHLLCVSKRRVDEIGCMDPRFNGAQDYDYTLRAVEGKGSIAHVPRILYHWRLHEASTSMNSDSKDYAKQAGLLALQAHCDRMGFNATVEKTRYPFAYRVVHELSNNPSLDIVIPNKDQASLLQRCVDSLRKRATYQNWRLYIVENNSVESQTFQLYDQLQDEDERVQVVTWSGKGFNYSQIVNYGASFGEGEYLLFLNNDTEIIEPRTLENLLGCFEDEGVGVVGAKLLFPDETVQHAGVGVGINGAAEHLFTSLPSDAGGYFERACLPQNLSAVTGACQMVRRSVYKQVEGYNEEFQVGYNDIDFCCKVVEAGYRCVYNPDALLYHFEFASRGRDMSLKRQERALREAELLRTRWKRIFEEGDPFLSPSISLRNGYFCLGDSDE